MNKFKNLDDSINHAETPITCVLTLYLDGNIRQEGSKEFLKEGAS
jgi:hypothetical protein